MSALLSPEDLKRQALANVQDATESNAENPALTALRRNNQSPFGPLGRPW